MKMFRMFCCCFCFCFLIKYDSLFIIRCAPKQVKFFTRNKNFQASNSEIYSFSLMLHEFDTLSTLHTYKCPNMKKDPSYVNFRTLSSERPPGYWLKNIWNLLRLNNVNIKMAL